jgi:hypothetical protein
MSVLPFPSLVGSGRVSRRFRGAMLDLLLQLRNLRRGRER